jgi:hypothetical protein
VAEVERQSLIVIAHDVGRSSARTSGSPE